MGEYNFQKDLAKAKKTELEAMLLMTHFNLGTELQKTVGKGTTFVQTIVTTNKPDGSYFKTYDFVVTNQYIIDGAGLRSVQIPVEVKEDFYCAKSGNVAIEYRCRNKASGIRKTEAKVWLIKAHQPEPTKPIWVLVPTKTLLDYINADVPPPSRTGGDRGSGTEMYLIPFSTLLGLPHVSAFSSIELPSFVEPIKDYEEYMLHINPNTNYEDKPEWLKNFHLKT